MADNKAAVVELKKHVRVIRRPRAHKPRGGYKGRKDGQDRKLPTVNRRAVLRRLRNHVKEAYPLKPDATATLPQILEWANRELQMEEWQGAPPEKKIKDIRQVLYQKRYGDTAKGVLKNERRKAKAAEARRALQEEEVEVEVEGDGDAAPPA